MSRKKRLTRIAPIQCGVILGALYAFFGLLFGIFITLFGAASAAVGAAEGNNAAGLMAGFGALAIVLIPLMYGVIGFISGVVCALLYNFIVKFVGGLVVEVSDEDVPERY